MTTSVRTVEVQRRVRASPATAFSYFTEPSKHVLWNGVRAELDPRPGGAYIVHLNEQTRVRGEYIEVDPPKRILLSWGWESTDQFPSGTRDIPPGSTIVEILFVPDGDGTIIRLLHRGLATSASVELTQSGWGLYLGRVDEAASGLDPGADPLIALLASMRSP